MVNVTFVKRPGGGTGTVTQGRSHSQIKMTPEVVEMITSAGIQIASIMVMGLVSIVLKQSLFPGN